VCFHKRKEENPKPEVMKQMKVWMRGAEKGAKSSEWNGGHKNLKEGKKPIPSERCMVRYAGAVLR
jgi:hypothetical protein